MAHGTRKTGLLQGPEGRGGGKSPNFFKNLFVLPCAMIILEDEKSPIFVFFPENRIDLFDKICSSG
jgi:hypothetical protein